MAKEVSYDAQAFKQFEHDGWDEVSATYHDTFGALTRQAVEPVLDAVGAGPGTRVLEVACGTGALAAAAAQRGAQATGVDLVEKMVLEARRLHPEVEFRQGDAEELPFPEGSFDAVGCNFGILHFPHPEQAIREAYRTLAPGGTYALTAWCAPDRSPYMGLVYSVLGAHADTSLVPAGPPLFRFGEAEECAQVFARAGFSDVEVADLPVVARFSDLSQVFDPFLKGSARTLGLYRRQSEEVQARIVEEIREKAKAFERDGQVEIPFGAVLATGRKG